MNKKPRRVLVADCEQEVSSFNPLLSQYEAFEILKGRALLGAHAGADTCLRGALDVLRAERSVEIVPLYGATACSAGPLSREAFERIAGELTEAVAAEAAGAAALYLSMHGAMGAEHEPDPEGCILERLRSVLGRGVPIVISLDLHGILTDRMLRHCDAVTVYHTYPHQDFISTGARAARLLLRILDEAARPIMVRSYVPALVRGPELLTATGAYGEVIDRAKEMEESGEALSAAMFIGNPFTDAPELGSQALVVTDNDADAASRLTLELAQMFWARHGTMHADLVPLSEAIADAARQDGTVTFTDAADAPSSGASGDSNAILRGLLEADYQGSVMMPIVDAPAAQSAHAAGLGAQIEVPLGGTIDPARFPPLDLVVTVERLGEGDYLHEFSRLPANAGPTAVLRHGAFRIVVVSRPVFMMDRAVFLAHGLQPSQADLVVVKSPGAFARYFTFATKNYVPDIPGSTSANLKSLGHKACPRPIFPLDEGVSFVPRVDTYRTVSAVAQ